MDRLHVVLFGLADAEALPVAVQRFVADAVPKVGFHANGEGLRTLAAQRENDPFSVLCVAREPGAVLDAIESLNEQVPWPFTLLSRTLSAGQAGRLVQHGVHAWGPLELVDAPALASLLASASARFVREAALRRELVQLRTRWDERRAVDKAKGLLMLARGMGEDDAFGMLRQAAMHANLRLGEVATSVVDAARWAEAINRAGQLRMLAQRQARFAVQALLKIEVRVSRERRREAADRVVQTLTYLDRLALNPACRAGLDRARAAADLLEASFTPIASIDSASAVDAAAEQLLACAETLTELLHAASGRRSLHIVNLCGRQRMLAERFVKEALRSVVGEGGGRAGLAASAAEFERALLELEQAPLTSPEIRAALAAAREDWQRLTQFASAGPRGAGNIALVGAVDALVETFERLAAQYEHSLQVIMA